MQICKDEVMLEGEQGQPDASEGLYRPQNRLFSGLEELTRELSLEPFACLACRKKVKKASRKLLELIESTPAPCFLLPAVIDYLAKVNAVVDFGEPFTLAHFEFWLNQFSGLDTQANLLVRAKIMGKYVPRHEYQCYFPIGTGKVLPGSHFIAAHLSPDMDTTICSFLGWCDAFAAKAAEAQHYWVLPGGPPNTPMLRLFFDFFGEKIFELTARTSPSLTLQSHDLVTKKNFEKVRGEKLVSSLDHGEGQKAIIVVDEKGYYCGDWRSSDAELVRQVIVLFKSCLHWFENNLHIRLISFFALLQPTADDAYAILEGLLEQPIADWDPVGEFTLEQQKLLGGLLADVLEIEQGVKANYKQLAVALNLFDVYELSLFAAELLSLPDSPLFDSSNKLVDDKTAILNKMEQIIVQLDVAIHCVRNFIERIDMVMLIKKRVFKQGEGQYASLQLDLDDIRLRIKNLDYLTVVMKEEGKLYPVGVIWARQLLQQPLGTVSMRDFSNFDEIRMPPYLHVVSIIDHHPTAFVTRSTPRVIVGDVQSSNTLLAEIAMGLNANYSLGGMTPSAITQQMNDLSRKPLRVQEKLAIKARVAQRDGHYWVAPEREIAEYLSLIYGILDDTDLLTKVTGRDVDVVAELLNRLKTLTSGKEEQVIDFQDLDRGENYPQMAARILLRSKELFCLYSRMYKLREELIQQQVIASAAGAEWSFFEDTKEQNGCCRIGQSKLFESNFAVFMQNRAELVGRWCERASHLVKDRPEVDLHLHMISTIASADQMYRGGRRNYGHKDELWVWVPDTQSAFSHLGSFLLAFGGSEAILHNHLQLILPHHALRNRIKELFDRNFLPLKVEKDPQLEGLKEQQRPLAVVRFNAGSLNSRKEAISPFLPRQLTTES